jgi:hypothetical protein
VFGPAVVEQHFQSLNSTYLEMKLAFWADKKIRVEVFAKRNRAAIFALGPKTFRAYAPLFGRRRFFNSFFFSLEPGHFDYQFHALRANTGQKFMPRRPFYFNELTTYNLKRITHLQ